MRITLYYGKTLNIRAKDIYTLYPFTGAYNAVDPRVMTLVKMNDDTEYYCTEPSAVLTARREAENRE